MMRAATLISLLIMEVLNTKVVKVTLNTAYPLKMDDPAVQAAMAEQICQTLQATGKPAIRVTWRQQPDGNVFHKEKTKDAKKKLDKREEI